jgi:hypothetical protein
VSEKQVTILLCDLPHKREVRATDTLTVESAITHRSLSLDVCNAHGEMLFGNGTGKARRSGIYAGDAEALDKMPAGWIDAAEAAGILGITTSGVRYLMRSGALEGRSVKVAGHPGGPFYIFERAKVRARARAA